MRHDFLAAAPDLLVACRKALPHVQWVADALRSAEAADALGSLRDVLALFPEDWPMKTARERALEAVLFLDSYEASLLTNDGAAKELERAFKEYARDQRHICAEAVQDRSYADASYRVADAVHEAVMNAPFPGE